MKERLVVFDFDGTLTRRDSLLVFTRYYHGNLRFALGLVHLAPVLLDYKLGKIPNYLAKEQFLTHFFADAPLPNFQEICDRFSLEKIPMLLRPSAVRRLEVHRERGDQLVLVSASAENWLHAWCRRENLPLIATRLEIRDNLVTGKLLGPNCYGPEKVRRLKEEFELDDFDEIIVYGDSRGDFELFEIATCYFYKPF